MVGPRPPRPRPLSYRAHRCWKWFRPPSRRSPPPPAFRDRKPSQLADGGQGETLSEGARRGWQICSVLKIAAYEQNPPQLWFTMITAVKIGRTKIRHRCGNCATILQNVT